jgi:hypothetical protein
VRTAVLVAVFGLLDKLVRDETLSFRWMAEALGCAFLFQLLGIGFKIVASE